VVASESAVTASLPFAAVRNHRRIAKNTEARGPEEH
jgi:hypothetical protein